MWFPHKKISSQVSANPNIFNIMAGFGRYDHVTKNLIVFGAEVLKILERNERPQERFMSRSVRKYLIKHLRLLRSPYILGLQGWGTFS